MAKIRRASISGIMFLAMSVLFLIFFSFFGKKDTTPKGSFASEIGRSEDIICPLGAEKSLTCRKIVKGRISQDYCLWRCIPNF